MPALAALPDLALCVVAGFLLVLALALFALRNVLTGAFSHVPVIGGFVAGSLAGLVDRAATDVLNASGTVWKTSAAIFRSVGSWARGMWAGAVLVWQETAHTIDNIVTVTIPRIATEAASHIYHYSQQVLAQAATWYHDALAYADHIGAALDQAIANVSSVLTVDVATHWQDAKDYARSLYNKAEADITAVSAVLYGDLVSAVKSLEADVSTHWTDAKDYARSLFNTAQADTAAAVAAAEAAATSALNATAKGIVTDLEVTGDYAVSTVWPDAAGDIDALKQVLGDAFPDISSLLKFLTGAGAAGLTGALIRALAGSAVATRALNDCVIPNCRNLSQLGKDLSELGSAVSVASMVAFAVAAVTDPVATANATVAVTAPVADVTVKPLASLISNGNIRL